MRIVRIAILLGLVLFFCFSLTAQQPPRDPQATAVLTSMVAATGWNSFTAPRDVIGSGVFTRYIADSKDTAGITIKARSANRVRTELQDGSPGHTQIINGNQGILVTPEGTLRIPSHVAAFRLPYAFPFLTDLAATTQEGISVSYLGTETVRGELCHRVEILREPPPDFPRREHRRKVVALQVWVSATTGLPVRIQYNHVAFDNPTATLPVVRYFSDYRPVAGLLVPFHQEEFIAGELRYVLQFSRVDFNVGLSDADFDVPTVQN